MNLALGTIRLIAAGLPDPNSYSAVGWVTFILVLIIWGINQVMDLTAKFKPQPPLNDQFEAVRVEAREGRAKIHTHIREAKDEIKETFKALEARQLDHAERIVALETEVWRKN